MSKLLDFVRFKDFDLWDVKRHLSSLIYSDYEIVKLGDYIQEENKKIKPFEYPNNDFKILGVSNKIGLFDNEVKKGKDINQHYKKVDNGFLAYNPYRINVDSIGLKTNKQKNDLISPAYVVFSCDEKLLPEYLFMIFKTNTFNIIINESTRGSVRQILAFDILENLKIPLPPLDIQKKIVQDYQDKLSLSALQEQEAEDKEKEIEEYLYKALGISLSKTEESNLLSFVNFKNIERWDAIYLLDRNNIKSSYPLIAINNIINTFLKDLNDNSLRIESKKFPNENFKYIGMENIEKETGNLFQFQDVKGKDIKSQTVKLPKNFFLYGKLRPYLNKYYLNKSDYENIIVSSD
jgi:type I restriction enzyme S subunit